MKSEPFGPSYNRPILLYYSIIDPTFIGYKEISSYWPVQSLVTINRQTSNDSGILRQGYGIIRQRLRNHTRFADWVTSCVVHLPEWTETGLIYAPDLNNRIGSDCAGRAWLQKLVYNSNSDKYIYCHY